MAGTYTMLTDLLLFEAGASGAATRGDTDEVANYPRALEGAIAGLADLPISTRLVRDAHRVLLTPSRGIAVQASRRAN